ncbi:uncharacterized protein LOC110861996 [Folsomia candida]|uniref:Uncharacterized protein n=1 Tax=Folsomia candida TaxID=158441 RepID=A0A226CYR9_FOLCA|nr:uncharacterized protein LOC110861996 [Folsomia candida]OXA38129.1 hypothetical protein Fcan01_27129 [Folsomia candida]
MWGFKTCSHLLSGGPLLLLLLNCLVEVSGIRCYECSSSWNDDCTMSPPPSRYLKLCSVPLCSKFYAEENGIIRVERYCGGSDFSNGCRDASFPDRSPGTRYRAMSCRCNDQDGCNAALNLNASFSLLIIISTTVLNLWWFQTQR